MDRYCKFCGSWYEWEVGMLLHFCSDDCHLEAKRAKVLARVRTLKEKRKFLKSIENSYYAKTIASRAHSEYGRLMFEKWIRERCYTGLTDKNISDILEKLWKK